jgi:hypothetical protein
MNVLYKNAKEILLIIDGKETTFHHDKGKALELMLEITRINQLTIKQSGFVLGSKGKIAFIIFNEIEKCLYIETCGMDADILLNIFRKNLLQQYLEDTEILEIAA